MPGTYAPFGIVETNFQYHGLDVAFAAADVALGGEIRLRGFEKHLAGSLRSTGQADAQCVSEANMISLGFRDRRAHPGIAKIHNGDDGLSGITYSPSRAARTETFR